MPISKYFNGHGEEVLDSIKAAHPKMTHQEALSAFYATAKTQNAKPGANMRKTSTGAPHKGKADNKNIGSTKVATYQSDE